MLGREAIRCLHAMLRNVFGYVYGDVDVQEVREGHQPGTGTLTFMLFGDGQAGRHTSTFAPSPGEHNRQHPVPGCCFRSRRA